MEPDAVNHPSHYTGQVTWTGRSPGWSGSTRGSCRRTAGSEILDARARRDRARDPSELKMPPRRKLNPVPEPKRTAPDLRQAVELAVAGMDWLQPSDLAMVDVARSLADQIETAVELADEYTRLVSDVAASGDDVLLKRVRSFEKRADMQKVVGWFAPMLQGVLRDLGGAPLSRKLMAEEQPAGDRLSALRSMVSTTKTNRAP